jgi:hypothetical protein
MQGRGNAVTRPYRVFFGILQYYQNRGSRIDIPVSDGVLAAAR